MNPIRKRETPKHQLAFETYWAMGQKRSLAKLAQTIGISRPTAEDWSKAFSWQERLTQRDKVVKDMIADQSTRAEAEMRDRILSLCRATMVRFAQMLNENRVKVDPDGFVRVANLELVMRGQPTERAEHVVRGKGQDRKGVVDFILRTAEPTDRNRRYLDALRKVAGAGRRRQGPGKDGSEAPAPAGE